METNIKDKVASIESAALAEEFLRFAFWSNFIQVAICTLSVALCVGTFIILFKKGVWSKEFLNVWSFWFSPVSAIVLFFWMAFSIVFSIKPANECIKIKASPKIYLMDKAEEYFK